MRLVVVRESRRREVSNTNRGAVESLSVTSRILRTIIAAGALGAISVVYSEALFWARWRSTDSAGGYALSWLAYSLVSLLVLMLIERFDLRGVLGLVLAGAVFGWLVEGAVATTLYDDLPWSISWTGLAWHDLITVVGGWLLVPRAMATWSPRRLVRWSILVGAAWGMWAVTWRVEDGFWTPIGTFTLFAFASAAVLAVGYLVWQRTYLPVPWRRGAAVAIAAVLAVSAFVQAGASALILVLLVGAVVGVMTVGRGGFEGPLLAADQVFTGLVALPVAAASASVVFAALQRADAVVNTAALFYLFTMPAGLILLIMAVSRSLKRLGAR